MNIIIRADSSAMIGSGHLTRCLALAIRHRKKGDTVHFICRDLSGNVAKLVEKQDFFLHMLPNAKVSECSGMYANWLTVSQERDALEVTEILRTVGVVDVLVVDHYALDITWEQMLRPLVGGIFVIDDLANRHHDCDWLLDQNFYLNKETRYEGMVPKHCQMLLGPKYALLRDEFYEIRKKMKRITGVIRSILVFYGGVDATNETGKALQALCSMKASGEIDDINVKVVVGTGNLHKKTIADVCQKKGFTYLCQVNNMAELMVEADIMLGAGGTTTWERCYLELPSIVTSVAENQFKICEDCYNAGLIIYLGSWNKVSVFDYIASIRRMMSQDVRLAMQNEMRQLFA